MHTYALAPVAGALRLDHWNEQLSLLFSDLTADPCEIDAFDGRLAWGELGSIFCASAWAKPCDMHHGADTMNQSGDHVLLKFQRTGRSMVSHLGRDSLLQPGDLILFDTEKPHRLTLLEDSEMLAIRIPRSILSAEAQDLGANAGRRLAGSDPSVRLCSGYSETLWQLCRKTSVSAIPANATRILSRLIDNCLPGGHESASRLDWQSINAYIEDHLFDPDLTIAQVSADLGVTARWLQSLFAQKGTTPARYILEERLTEAGRRFSDPAFRTQSVTMIAFDLGFGDLTYFGRAFRARYGISPRDFRRYDRAA